MKDKSKMSARQMPVGIAVGTLISIFITLLGAGILAYLISTEKSAESSMGAGSMIVLIAASALGSWAAGMMVRNRYLLVYAATSTVYYLCLLAITALFFDGQYEGMGTTALAVLSGAGIVYLLNLAVNRQGKRNRKIPAYR